MVRNSSPLVVDRRTRRYSRHSGFTLLEAIVAIVMFTFIILAASQAFNVSLQATARSQHRQEDDGTVRAIFDVITRDILAGYGSPNSPASVFTAGSSGSSGGSGSAGLLTFSALSTRLQTPELDSQSGTGPQNGSAAQGTSQPQSDMSLIKYTFDSASGMLYRVVSAVPSAQSLSQSSPTPDQAVAQNVAAIQFSFWDPTQQNWRTDWDYEQQNQIGVTPLSSGTSGSTSSSSSSGQGTANTTATGDTYLPTAIKITVTLQQSNGQTQDFVTTIPVGASQIYLDPNQTANVNSNPPTSSGNSPAAGGP